MTDNDNLELKKRSRRRLVGAAALALLAAIVLPMVMDQEPGPAVQDIQVTIPDRDADTLLARPIAGRAPEPVDPPVAPAPEEEPPAPAGETPVRTDKAPAEAPVAAERATPPVVRAAPDATAAPAPEAPAQASAPKPAQPVPGKTPSAPDEAARARALLEGRGDVVAASEQSFVVQVGAFGEAGKAKSLSTDLKGRGFSAYTEKSGTVTRVRVGPFASREQAEKVAAGLRAKGYSGVVATR